MQKKHKKLTACAVAAMLGLSCMVYPVHAEEAPSSGQTDTGGLLEVDETAVPMEESTEPEATPTPEAGETVTAPEEDKEEFTSEPVETEEEAQPEADEPEFVTQEQTENEADKEEFTSESVETEQEAQPEATEHTKVEAEPQEQTEVQENAVLFADTNTFNINENSVNITQNGTYTINGNGSATTNTITVAENLTVTITLNNVNIDVSATNYACAFDINGNSTATVILSGDNRLKSGEENAGLQYNNATEGKSLTIQGTGSLTATGGKHGAGIGGGWWDTGKNITITGGSVTATGGRNGAGIGGGGDRGENITITGGTVTATGGYNGAGIGGGFWDTGENITITGGSVTATGGDGGAGIGGGRSGSGNNITITGGTVTATSGYDGAGIGGGLYGGTNNIQITGGSVKASSIGTTPTDGNGKNVYLAKLENQNDVNQVIVDSNTENANTFKRAGNHPDGDTAFYLYLTGENHDLQIGSNYYKTLYNDGNFTIQSASKPDMPTVEIDTSQTTASSITVKELKNQNTYGEAEYKIADREWQDSNVFENLHSSGYGGDKYTVYARYKGNDTYVHSDVKSISNVSTSAADYTITIPANPDNPLVAGKGDSISTISVNQEQPFDLGYNGQVDVKVKNDGNVTDRAELNLTRQNDTENHKITSALLVNNTALGNINTSIATFKVKNDNPVTVSFAKPTDTDIPAGTYSGTITFEVSYSEQ